MARIVEDAVDVADLHDFAQVHHGDPVGDVPHHGQVVGHHQVAQPEFRAELVQQVDDPGLDGHVQGGHRLVQDHEFGVHGEGAGDPDALALAAGELVGEAVDVVRLEAHEFHQLHDPLTDRRLGHARVLKRLGQHFKDGEARVEGAGGVLEHHLEFLAHGALGLCVGGFFVAEAADDHLAVLVLVELHDFQQGGGFAAAGLADDREALALADVEAQPVDRLDGADPAFEQGALHQREVLPDVPEFQHGPAFCARDRVKV